MEEKKNTYYDLMVTYDIDGESKSKGYVDIEMFVHDYRAGYLPSEDEVSNIRAAFNMNESDVRSFKSFSELCMVCKAISSVKDDLRNDMINFMMGSKNTCCSLKPRMNKKRSKNISKMKKKSRKINHKRSK